MTAELGQTTDPKELIPGEPEIIANDLRHLLANIEQVEGTGNDLSLIDPTQWVGSASDAFRAAFGEQPPLWTQAAEFLGQSGQSLADFGDVLTWGQGEAQRAIELYAQAQAATRAAAAQYQARAAAAGQTLAPFHDPGQTAAREAQAILDNARMRVEHVGDQITRALGLEPDGEGGYRKTFGDREYGAERRRKEWDPDSKQWVDKGGWQDGRGGRSYSGEWGSRADGLLGDQIGKTLKALGIDIPESSGSASVGVDMLGGSLKGGFDSGPWSGGGKLEGSLFGAGAEAHYSASALGVTAGASAEAYVAKGAAEGEIKLGDHAGVSAKGEAIAGAAAHAGGSIGVTGIEGSAGAFVGGRASVDGSAEVAGVSAGVHAEGWAGAGAEADGQFGLGDDGKFHVGASLGVGLGLGGKVGFDVAIDPAEVVDTVQDVAGDVAGVAEDIGSGVADAADSVGDFFGL
jgi:hypothetical protein